MQEKTITVVPHLTCRNAAEAFEFYQKAFGAEKVSILPGPDGRIMHAALKLGDYDLFLNDEFLDHGVKGPLAIGGTPVTIHLHVPDCDAVFARAVEAGCTATMPVEDQFWGDRYGMVTDPYGHQWGIATTLREMSKEELTQAMDAMGG